jgi:integrative and conjugative element protein (TIGR02256 family)
MAHSLDLPVVPLKTNLIQTANRLEFALDRRQTLVIAPNVIQHLLSERQLAQDSPESGGQLFADIRPQTIVVRQATGPYTEDQRRPFWFFPNRTQQRRDIKRLFKQSLHYIGDWHTHPENKPSPSNSDLQAMADCFLKSRHQLESFLMIIVGTSPNPADFWISLHDAVGYRRLSLLP